MRLFGGILKAESPIPDYEDLQEKIGSPFFIKPANMGSSVGVNKIHNNSEYLEAVKIAFDYDLKSLSRNISKVEK